MFRIFVYGIIGYLSGSILYARIFGYLIKQKDVVSSAKDKNPGTANAFMQGGFLCGVLTLLFDLAKGFLPVYLYTHGAPYPEMPELGLPFVMAMPVIGHIWSVFYRFHGGKGIATTFGVLLGLFPNITPAFLLAFFFLFFSLVLRVTPHYNRTIWTYISTFIVMMLFGINPYLIFGFFFITMAVLVRLRISDEDREECKVRLLWKH